MGGALFVDAVRIPRRAACRNVARNVGQRHVLASLGQQPGHAQPPASPAPVAGQREHGDVPGCLTQGDEVRAAGMGGVAHGASEPRQT